MNKWCIAALLALAAAGCSGMSEDDPAYPYQDTRWVDEQQATEFHMEDGKASWISYGDEVKEFESTYTVNEKGNIVFVDETKENFKMEVEMVPRGENLISPVLGVAWVPMTPEREERLRASIKQREEANRVRNAPRPSSTAGYKAIPYEQLLDVLASHMVGEIPDDNLAEIFIEGYSSNLDGFAKRDLLDRELPKVKARLAEIRNTTDYSINLISGPGMQGAIPGVDQGYGHDGINVSEYDFDKRTFPVSGFWVPCHPSEMFAFGVQEVRGAKFTVKEWGIKGDEACRLTPSDEQVARQIEEARQSFLLRFKTTVYFRVTGQKERNGAMAFDIHRADVQPYLEFRAGEYKPIGGVITLTAPAGGSK